MKLGRLRLRRTKIGVQVCQLRVSLHACAAHPPQTPPLQTPVWYAGANSSGSGAGAVASAGAAAAGAGVGRVARLTGR